MKLTLALVSLLATPGPVLADGVLGSLVTQLKSLGQSAVEELQSGPAQTNPPFNAQQQLVDVTGIHAWQAPGPNDARGPCPGLNALSNHGYLPRNGLATVVDLISATTEVFGMGLDLAAILSAYGGVMDGPGAAWSIGGSPHIGISGSHNNYETDSSPVYADLYQYGSNVDVVLSQFAALFNMQPDPATANYDISVLSRFRGQRFHESIAKNPYFFYAPFAGVAVSQAAYAFIYRFMANHTAEHPAGILNQEVLKSFFAISGDDVASFTWTPGHERIPDNWYTRADGDAYGFFGLNSDIGTLFRQNPGISTAGCNTGKVNTFTPLNFTDTSGNPLDLSNPTNAVCYGLGQAISAGTKANNGVAIFVVEELLLPIENALGCVTVPALNETTQQACPGYSFWGGPKADVAPGAVQN